MNNDLRARVVERYRTRVYWYLEQRDDLQAEFARYRLAIAETRTMLSVGSALLARTYFTEVQTAAQGVSLSVQLREQNGSLSRTDAAHMRRYMELRKPLVTKLEDAVLGLELLAWAHRNNSTTAEHDFGPSDEFDTFSDD